ncbi:hypothetical protein DFH09DRAFT_1320143 [Mycena vulgaris]|nr:hypothetical protein DFH09DRAFT_1320143 [Mycena vulgaris]
MGLCFSALGGKYEDDGNSNRFRARASWRQVPVTHPTSTAPLCRRDAARVTPASGPLARVVLAAGEVNTPHSANANARTLETGWLLLIRGAYPLLFILLMLPSRPLLLPHYLIAHRRPTFRCRSLRGVLWSSLACQMCMISLRQQDFPVCAPMTPPPLHPASSNFGHVPSSHPPRLLAPVKRPYRHEYLLLAGFHEAGYLRSGTSVGAYLRSPLLRGVSAFAALGSRPWAVRREESLVHASISFFCAPPSGPAYCGLFPPPSPLLQLAIFIPFSTTSNIHISSAKYFISFT